MGHVAWKLMVTGDSYPAKSAPAAVSQRRIEISQTREQLTCNRAEPMSQLARQRADGVIDRSKTRDTPHSPVALYEVAHLFGTLVAETILASVHVRTHPKAGHMDASDLISALQNPFHIWGMLDKFARGFWGRAELADDERRCGRTQEQGRKTEAAENQG
jgi:hypothetical protein